LSDSEKGEHATKKASSQKSVARWHPAAWNATLRVMGLIHLNRVLYKRAPGNPVYRQIVVVEESAGRFEMRIFEGDVLQTAPFKAENSDAEVHFYTTRQKAEAEALSEFDNSLSSQEWAPYDPMSPPKYP
jgi:hypothetical protein